MFDSIYELPLKFDSKIESSASAQIKLVIEVKKHRIIIFLIIAFIKIHFLHFVIIQYFLHFFMRITDKRVLIR